MKRLVLLLALAPLAAAQGEPTVRAVDEGAEATYAFEPARLEAAPGADVLVAGGTKEPHTLTHDAPQRERRFSTGNIDPGATATFAAPVEAGEYPFLCLYHPGMRGTLVVAGEGAPAATTPARTPPTTTATATTVPPTPPRDAPAPAWLALAGVAAAALVLRRRR